MKEIVALEEQQEGGYGKKYCQFGTTRLELCRAGDEDVFIPKSEMPVDPPQKCLLDAIWRSKTRMDKLRACNALQYYFHKIQSPPLGRNFSYYALVSADVNGIYPTWYDLTRRMEASIVETDLSSADYKWKGFYAFRDAFNWIDAQVLDEALVEFDAAPPRGGAYVEEQQQENKELKAQNKELMDRIAQLMIEVQELKPKKNDRGKRPIS